MESLQNELADLKKQLDSERTKAQSLENEKNGLMKTVDSLKQKEASGAEVLAENTRLSQELESLQKRLDDETKQFTEERTTLQQTIEVTNELVADQERQVQQLKEEVNGLQVDKSVGESQKAMIEKLEDEKLSLLEKVSELETTLQDTQSQTQARWEKSSNPTSDLDEDGDPAVARLQEEKEMAEGQVNFLNSVIVDLQHKNDELRARLEAIENGFTLNGNMDHDLSDLDLEPGSHGPPPRLFCDICDVFDLHDTEDCPLQASSDSPPPSQHHGTRGEERAYCDTCEMFGHWTENCDDEQTY